VTPSPRTALSRSLASDAASSLLARPWRTLASAVGVLFGVASGAVTLTLAASQQAQVDRNFDRQLTPLVVLEPAPIEPALNLVGAEPIDRLERQLDDIGGRQTGGELTTWRREAQVAATASAPTLPTPVFSATVSALDAIGSEDLTGSTGLLDSSGPQPLAWIGSELAADLGLDLRSGEGAAVVVDGAPLTVAGVLSEATRFPSIGRAVVVSADTAAHLWSEPEQRRIVVEVRRGSASVVARHLLVGLDPTGRQPIANVTPPDGTITRTAVGNDLQQAGLTLSAVSLVIGTVSVAGVMTSSVVQRTREIGLRAALGWSSARISALIVTEALALGIFAAVVGTAIGLAAATAVCDRNGWPTVAPTYVAWLPPILGVVAGGLGGLVPALRASRISPTEALRG
jgi:putative ABC transport system permease protein